MSTYHDEMQRLETSQLKELPPIRGLKGDAARNLTPLEQFYHRLIFGWGRVLMCPAYIDKRKVWISDVDARWLYHSTREYIEGLLPDSKDASQVAIKLWLQIGPEVDAQVPTGKVRLFDGYVVVPLEDMEFFGAQH